MAANIQSNLNNRSMSALAGQYKRLFGKTAPATASKSRLINSIKRRSDVKADDRRMVRAVRRGLT